MADIVQKDFRGETLSQLGGGGRREETGEDLSKILEL